jgi:hypothetical protein
MLSMHFTIGLALAIAGALIPRVVSRAKLRLSVKFLLDLVPSLLGFALIAALTARPILAGTVILSLMIGFAFVDWVKRATLLEPAVFSDLGELIELFRHPDLYLPFAGPIRVIMTAIGIFILFAILFVYEAPAWAWTPIRGFALPLIIVGVGWAIHGPFIRQTAQLFRRLNPTGDPFRDAADLGPSSMQFTYSFIARDERPARQAEARKSKPALVMGRSASATPVVVVQSESFFDPRRLHVGIPAGIVPHFESCRQFGIQSGRLAVNTWGANTMRTEFAVLTGLPDEAVGYDRFNPYFAFARTPLPSLASRMREQGYRTICLHPFDRTFYRRDHVLPYLGFDVFIGEEGFAGASRSEGYIRDEEVGKVAVELMREEGPHTFIFIITMENHGPWPNSVKHPSGVDMTAGLPAIPEKAQLNGFLHGVQNADALLGTIAGEMSSRGGPGLCAFYGDHLPSFPAAFPALGFKETSSDYLIWHSQGGMALERDLAAHELSGAIFSALTKQHIGETVELARSS